jgi:hypothetical protein
MSAMAVQKNNPIINEVLRGIDKIYLDINHPTKYYKVKQDNNRKDRSTQNWKPL